MAARRLVRAALRLALPQARPTTHRIFTPRLSRHSEISWSQTETSFRSAFPACQLCRVREFASAGSPPIVLGMPALSPTMTQGNVVQWKKKEGDKVSPGDVLCVIETDKATVDFESVEEGYLAKIVVPAGSNNVPVGQTIGVMVEDEEDIAAAASGAGQPSPKKEAPKASNTVQEAAVKPSPAQNLPPHIVLGMPALSPTMTQGNIVEWKKKEGDQVAPGDVLCVIETDKATVDFESVEEGYLARILSPSGSKNVPVGQTIGVLVEEAEDIGKVAEADFGGQSAPAKKAEVHVATASSSPGPKQAAGSKTLSRVGPSVRRLLAESGLDASSITGTGPRGAVLKGDVLTAMKGGDGKQPSPAPKPRQDSKGDKSTAKSTSTSVAFDDIPTSQIRKIIAKRLLESKFGIPHFYVSADAILDSTLVLRKEMKEKHGATISVNDFVIRATALALKSVPEANAYWDEKAGEIVYHKSIDISIAVATDKGLITPIVKSADLKSLSAISSEVKSLAEKARNGKLKPEEFQGGTFSISNLGMFPVDRFSAIINPPQACILAVGRGEKVVIWDECPETGEGKPKTVTKMGMTLSVDNRVFDTTVAGRLLEALAANLQDPERMLL